MLCNHSVRITVNDNWEVSILKFGLTNTYLQRVKEKQHRSLQR